MNRKTKLTVGTLQMQLRARAHTHTYVYVWMLLVHFSVSAWYGNVAGNNLTMVPSVMSPH